MKKGDKMTYRELHKEAMKPISDRKKTVTGHDGEKKPVRRHCISERAAKQLRSAKGVQNPYKRGSYFAIVQSLINLGADKWHSFDKFKAEVKKVMSSRTRTIKDKKGTEVTVSDWDKFENRQARNKNTGKDLNGRLIQNTEVLQRISGNHPYGEKLRQIFACIDIDVDKPGLPKFRLNTQFRNYTSVQPINNLRRKPKAKTATKKVSKSKAKPKAKSKVKVSKPAKSVKVNASKPKIKKTSKKAPATVSASDEKK